MFQQKRFLVIFRNAKHSILIKTFIFCCCCCCFAFVLFWILYLFLFLFLFSFSFFLLCFVLFCLISSPVNIFVHCCSPPFQNMLWYKLCDFLVILFFQGMTLKPWTKIVNVIPRKPNKFFKNCTLSFVFFLFLFFVFLLFKHFNIWHLVILNIPFDWIIHICCK